ncbi:hypothetical protein N2152v2_008281 [Parachlorella kessleri]
MVVAAPVLCDGTGQGHDGSQLAEVWTASGGAGGYGEETLVVKPGSVCWLAGGLLRKQYTTSPVLKAAWAYFQNTGSDRIFCLLQDAAVTIYTQDGDSHIVPLPGRFTGLWPLPQGVLLTGCKGQGPCILVHPLENIQQISAGPGSRGGGGWGDGEEVVWSSLEVPFLVTYNRSYRRTAVWSVSTQPAQGFVAVTPMQWPGTPKTPVTQAHPALHTPASRSGVPGSATGGQKKPSLRLPNGGLSPLAFQPVPRSAPTPAPALAAGSGGDGQLLLPSEEVPVHFSLLWEQHMGGEGVRPDEAHLATDDNGGSLLCLLSRGAQRVVALRLPQSVAHSSLEVAFSLPAVSVAAVSATFRGSQQPPDGPSQQQPPKDLLVLHPDGRLCLYMGPHQVCTVQVPAPTGGPAGSPLSNGSPASPPGIGAAGPYAALLGGLPERQDEQQGLPRGGVTVRVYRGESSQMSVMRRHSSAGGEVHYEGIYLGSDSDEEMATMSPSPPPASAPPERSPPGDPPLPDVRSLAEALREPLEPLALKDAAGNRVTVVGRDGGSLRVSLPFHPASQLASSVLDGLRSLLAPELWWRLYGRWLEACGGCCGGDGGREWQALSRVVLQWARDPATLQQQPPPPHVTTGTPAVALAPANQSTTSSGPSTSTGVGHPAAGGATPVSAPVGSTAWEQLLGSTPHRFLLRKRRLPWAADLTAGEGEGEAGQAAAQPSPTPTASREQAWRALQALHSVYEDMKMSVLSWHLLVPLAELLADLAELAGAPAYRDHYGRDLGAKALPTHTSSSAQQQQQRDQSPQQQSGEPVPDMFRALHTLLAGSRDRQHVPALVQHRAPCMQRSLGLLACYGLLADVAEACCQPDLSKDPRRLLDVLEAGSQRLVLELVRRRWTLADLDTLPWGVALPLRQALHQCRGSPPGDWPREAYVLIGRNDIAAGMTASQEHDKPEGVGSAIVGTPLGRMAKTGSPAKKPLRRFAPPGGTPGMAAPGAAGGVTPGQGRIPGAPALFTPPAQALHRPPAPQGSALAAPELLQPPDGGNSRLPAQPELLPLPYAQRVLVTGALSPGSQPAGPTAAGSSALAGTGSDPSAGDGMENLTQQAARLRFGRDLRLVEVRGLLRSSAPVTLRMGTTPQATDAEGAQMQQVKLTTLAVRTMALPLGRGALTLSTLHPLPTEPLHIPVLCMAGRLPEQNNAVVNLDLSAAPPAPGSGAFCDYTAWPEFHNGVAAGLRLAPSGHQLTRTWIVYNKPEEPSYTHAGLLMALGLTGHLSCLAATDLYRYLSQEHDATIIGVLLGMAAAKRGTHDTSISRMLFLHLPTRHPSTYPELEMSALVQAAALLGVGLLFQGSCHRMMAEVMLEEIGRRPGAASKQTPAEATPGVDLHQGVSHDREGYALAAGMALGLITLGRGRKALGLADLHLEERLRYFMLGGSESGTVASQRGLAAVIGQGNAATEGVFGPGIIGFDPTLGEPQQRFVAPARDSGSGRSGGTVAEELAAAQGSSQVVLEGELVNLEVTSPAATLALGLMYLHTNDTGIARVFALPDTHFALDFVRPEHLQLRVLMRALVLWDGVRPTEDWLQAQLPQLIRLPSVDQAGDATACCLHGAPSLRVAVQGPLAKILVLPEEEANGVQAHCYALAGACLAVGIRHAGSCSAPAQALLRKQLLYFLEAKQGLPEPGAGSSGPLTRDVVESCVGSVALALAVVMAGSGHLDTLKLLRGLRKRLAAASAANAAHPGLGSPPTSSYTYGAHMAVSMALGFLFLGAGALTFATTPQAVASLVISLFPRFPMSTTDNRCHLQAFRHLYALAAQPRSVDAVDVDTHQPVYVPLDITLAPPPAQPPGAVLARNQPAEQAAGGLTAGGLRPVTSLSKGAADVLAQYAAEDGEGGNGSGEGVTYERVAPCLLPEKQQVTLVHVKGPRYWPQVLTSAGKGRSLDALYKTQTLFVQRKAGALPYASDPTGVRSLLSRMFQRGGADEGGADLVNLCATFGSDPFINQFAQAFCSEQGSGAGGFASQLPVSAERFPDFCRGALYECITREKPHALLPYLTLQCMLKGLADLPVGWPDLAAGLPPTLPLWSLKLSLAYFTGSMGLALESLERDTSMTGEGICPVSCSTHDR